MEKKNYSEDELFEKLINGEQIVEDVKTRRGNFKVKYPLGADLVEIDKRKAIMRGDIPPEKLSKQEDMNIEIYATLDQVVVDGPAWWKKLKSSMYCPDTNVIVELYRGYLRHYEQVQTALQSGLDREPDREVISHKSEKGLGDASFSHITYGPKVSEIDGRAG